jgi:hypothetical protein
VRTGYVVLERDPDDKPWLIIGVSHHTIELPDADEFPNWARERWPSPR